MADTASSRSAVGGAAWIALAVGTGVLVWGANALAARSGLRDPGALRAFLANLQIFAVAITSAIAAGVAWTCNGAGRESSGVPCWVLALLASLIGLGCGLAISWISVASAAAGPSRDLASGAFGIAGVVGAGFALVGAVVSDLSVGLAGKAARIGTRRAILLYGTAIVVLTCLWVAAGIVAASLARAQVCRP